MTAVKGPASPDRLAIRTVLLLGFGLTLGLWLFSGYYFTRRVADVQRQSASIHQRYMHSQELLSTVRTQVLLGAVYVRDALLDPTPGAVITYRTQLEAALRHVEDALQHYEPIIDSRSETSQIAQLRAEVDSFRATVLDVLATDSSRWRADARFLLRDRIMPKRQAVIRVSEEVQALNRAAFVEQQQASARVYATTQRRIWTQFGLALAASFAIGLVATRHVSGLEWRLREQQARDAANSRDLQRLSSQLISAQEEERRTIARELHDEVGQALTAIKVELALAQRSVEAAGGSPAILEEARTITDGALHTVRDLSRLLHPALLDDLGLCAAVEAYVREFRKRHAVSVELLHERMDERLPQATEAAAYRIVQEALTNVVRHAHATSCRVYIQRLVNTVLVTIQDDGIGFDADAIVASDASHGLGLLGIRERAAQLRGTVRIETAPGHGTRITVELPTHAAAPDAARPGGRAAPAATGMVHA
jgi:signal transduction histidine kinase